MRGGGDDGDLVLWAFMIWNMLSQHFYRSESRTLFI